jgi:hypothetical protein
MIMSFYTVSVGHTNGNVTNSRVVAADYTEARKLARRFAARLSEVSSVEVWL